MKSLQWLRGWVKPLTVQKEYLHLREFSKSIRTCAECQQSNIKCNHLKTSYIRNIQSLAQKRIQKPFLLCISMEIFLQFSALLAMRPYIIQIFKAYGIQLDANLVAVYMSIVSNISCLCLIFSIKAIGKRRLYLGSSVTCSLLCFALGEFHFLHLLCNFVGFPLFLCGSVVMRKAKLNAVFCINAMKNIFKLTFFQEFSDLFSSHRAGHHLETIQHVLIA